MKGQELVDYIVKNDLLDIDVSVLTSFNKNVVVLDVIDLGIEASDLNLFINSEPVDEQIKIISGEVDENAPLNMFCSRTRKEINIGDTILFEEPLYMGARIATCEAVVHFNINDGYYLDGFFMESGDRIPFKWKFLKNFYSNIRLANG